MSTLRAFTMPKWGIEMIEGTVAEWNIKEGERVTKGQVVAQIETDKIVNEIQSEFDMIFVRLLAKAGEVYPVGALLGVMATEVVPASAIDAFVLSFSSGGAAAQDVAASAAEAEAAPAPAAEAQAANDSVGGDATISSAAQRLAGKLKVDAARIAGSGRKGRVTYQDVEQASKPARTVGGGSAVSIAVKTEALDKHYAAPHAKRLSLEHGIDLSTLKGTGPRGRISRQDVAAAAGVAAGSQSPPSSPGTFDSVRMSATRKAIARQLSLSKSTIPHFYLRTQVNLDALLELRAEKKRGGGKAPSVNDYFIRASALALKSAPDVNIQVHGDEIRKFRNADISVAVAADRGLITPIIRAAETKSVERVSEEMRSLIERARAGKLRSEDIEGGTFTVSNLGMFGIDQFDAIINPPQGAILAIGTASRRPIERGGGLTVAMTAQLSLSCDHRAIDGAVGAQFLAALRDLLEAPQRL
jgi:pyruvate dehydrogenase E2 component (dihydrolipoamide acetyltransferase)